MPNPAGLNTTTLHMKFVEPNAAATPLQGTVTFSPSPSPILFPTQNVIVAGTETVTLDVNGEATIELVSTNIASENPSSWLYTVTERIIGQKQRSYNIALPFNNGITIELSDIEPTDAAPTYIPVVGPPGAPGLITSVNGYSVANVVLGAADVGAIPTTDRATATPPSVGTGAVGVSTKVAREDHTHNGVDLVNAQTIAGAKNFSTSAQAAQLGVGTAPGSSGARSYIKSIVDESVLLVQQTATAVINPLIGVLGGDVNAPALSAKIGADTVYRFAVKAGGTLEWGTGAATRDTFLTRSAAGELTATSTNIVIGAAAPTSAGHATRKDYVDSNFVDLISTQTISGGKTFSSTISTSASIDSTRGTPSNSSVTAKVTGDTVVRFNLTAGGTLQWGPGNAALDTTLSRSAANELTAAGQLIIGSAAPTAAGHVTRKDYVDNNFSSLTGNQTISGVKTLTGAPVLQQSAAGSVALNAKVAGEANPRLTIGADGTLSWGPGNATTDIALSRVNNGTGIVLNTAQSFQSTRSASSGLAFGTLVTSDTFDRYRIYASGLNEWGSGAVARDTNLYRSAASTLKTDNNLVVGGQFTVGNSGLYVISDWTPLSNLGTYTSPAGAGTPPPRVRKIMYLGREVWEFEGQLLLGSGYAGSTFFGFTGGSSSGYAPTTEHDFAIMPGSGSANNGVLRLYLSPAGNMGISPAPAGTVAYVSLDTVRIVNPNGV